MADLESSRHVDVRRPVGGADLRALLDRPGVATFGGVYDGLSAMLAERAGFDGLWISGLGVSAAHGVPDASVLQLPEFLAAARVVANTSSLPTIADCDAGFGDPNVLRRTAQLYAEAGVGGVSIEDKVLPKRNSFRDGHQLADPGHHAARLAIMRQAAADPDFVLVARLESLIAGAPMSDALDRAELYAEAGADVILIHSKAIDSHEVDMFCREWQARGGVTPLAAMPTMYPDTTAAQLSSVGIKLVIYANQALRASVAAMETAMAAITRDGSSMGIESTVAPVADILALIGSADAEECESWFDLVADSYRAGFAARRSPLVAADADAAPAGVAPTPAALARPRGAVRVEQPLGKEPVVDRLGWISRLQIAVSYYCNLHCEHCYVPEENRDEYKTKLEPDQLEIPQILGFMDHLIGSYGLERISVTGGEALLNKVWPRTRPVVEHGLRNGLEVQLNTSGSGQVPISEVVDLVAETGGRLVLHVSLDGIDQEQVNAFRGHSRAMQWALRTIREAVDGGLKVQIRYTATEGNLADTLPCYDLVEEIGVEEFVVKPMFAAGVARENEELIATIGPVLDLQRELLAASIGRSTKLVLPEPVYVPPTEFPAEANVRTIQCACGTESLYLSTDGALFPCTYLVGAGDADDWIVGNIKDPGFDFDAVWADPSTWTEFREAEKHGTCTAQNVSHRTMGLDESEPSEQFVSMRASGSMA